MRRTKGFTLIELLVVIAIIALLVSILVPSLNRARELAKRAVCGASLNGIGKGLAMWANDPTHGGDYPELDAKPYTVGAMTAGGNDDVQLLAADTSGNFMENLNLLVEDGLIGYKSFLCASSSTKLADRTGNNNKYGLYMYPDPAAASNPDYVIDYAYHMGSSMKTDTTTANDAAFTGITGDFAVMADADIGNKKKADGGWNHGDDGVNVLGASGGVKWVAPDTNDVILVSGDNIYTNGGLGDTSGTADASPTDSDDQVLYSPF